MHNEEAVRATPEPDTADRWMLLLEALAIPHDIRYSEAGWTVWVPAERVSEVGRLLDEDRVDAHCEAEKTARAEAESERLAQEWSRFRFNWPAALAFSTVLIGLFTLSDAAIENGHLSGSAVRAGEWWRLLTALTLHADVRHLLANLVVGTLLFGVVCGYLGSGVGSLATLAVGMLGNLLSVWVHATAYAALGASTAIFGMFGLLAGVLIARRRGLRMSTTFVPLALAFYLLLMFGMGSDLKTDVVAHTTGFVAGVFCGFPVGWKRPPLGPWFQLSFGATAGLLLTLAWHQALAYPHAEPSSRIDSLVGRGGASSPDG